MVSLCGIPCFSRHAQASLLHGGFLFELLHLLLQLLQASQLSGGAFRLTQLFDMDWTATQRRVKQLAAIPYDPVH